MSEQKTIRISPDLLSLSRGKTEKKSKAPKKPLRVKNDTLKRQSLLRMIRKHQDDKYKQQFSKPLSVKDTPNPHTNFENSKSFLQGVQSKYSKNETLKSTHLPKMETITPTIKQDDITFHASVPNNSVEPKYGCLKNGSLPTYRSVMNKTQRQMPVNEDYQNNTIQAPPSPNITQNSLQLSQFNALRNYNEKRKNDKQKRIIRKTFNLGKQKTKPITTVLVSSTKIRANITLKMQHLKQVSIDKIKKDLLKRGLIRIGTITPETVLRKIYETVHSICGSVQNHNKDNLLFNYLNGGI